MDGRQQERWSGTRVRAPGGKGAAGDARLSLGTEGNLSGDQREGTSRGVGGAGKGVAFSLEAGVPAAVRDSRPLETVGRYYRLCAKLSSWIPHPTPPPSAPGLTRGRGVGSSW